MCSAVGGGIIWPLWYLSGLRCSLIRLRKQSEFCLKDNVFLPGCSSSLEHPPSRRVYKVILARRLRGEAVARRQASHYPDSLCPGPEPMYTPPWSSCAHRRHSLDPAHWLWVLVGPPCTLHAPRLTPCTQRGPSWTLCHCLVNATDPTGLAPAVYSPTVMATGLP